MSSLVRAMARCRLGVAGGALMGPMPPLSSSSSVAVVAVRAMACRSSTAATSKAAAPAPGRGAVAMNSVLASSAGRTSPAPLQQLQFRWLSGGAVGSSKGGGKAGGGDDEDAAPGEGKGEDAADATAAGARSRPTANTQHHEWVKFQRSIAVDGFETGQVTVAHDGSVGGKRRGGKQLRKKKERERLERERDATPDLGGGHFPALRYSPEETARLLAEAHANIPPRAGPRRTRHLKRQKKRWWIKRKQDKVTKFYKLRTHHRRMEERSRRVGEVLRVKATAPAVRGRDEEYQREVLARWVAAASASGGPEP